MLCLLALPLATGLSCVLVDVITCCNYFIVTLINAVNCIMMCTIYYIDRAGREPNKQKPRADTTQSINWRAYYISKYMLIMSRSAAVTQQPAHNERHAQNKRPIMCAIGTSFSWRSRFTTDFRIPCAQLRRSTCRARGTRAQCTHGHGAPN